MLYILQLEEQISEGADEFTELKQEIAALQTKLNKYKSERLEANNNVSMMQKLIGDMKGKTPQLERDVSNTNLGNTNSVSGTQSNIKSWPVFITADSICSPKG